MHVLIQAADHGGPVEFARLGLRRRIRRGNRSMTPAARIRSGAIPARSRGADAVERSGTGSLRAARGGIDPCGLRSARPRDSNKTIEQLLDVLDRTDVVEAMDRLEAETGTLLA
jgi:hypothetical protein